MQTQAICDKCGQKIPYGAKFCSACGDPVTDEDFKQIATRDEKPQIKISFGYSSSAAYDDAVNLARQHPSFTQNGTDKKTINSAVIDFIDIEFAVTLWDMVGSWKSSKMLVNRKAASKKDLSYGAIGCYRKRISAEHPDTHCSGRLDQQHHNIFKCHKLEIPIYDIFTQWGKYGSIEGGRALKIDKKSMSESIKLSYLNLRLCPAFDTQHIESIFKEIPANIDLVKYNGRFSNELKDTVKRVENEIEWERETEKRTERFERQLSDSAQTHKQTSAPPKTNTGGIIFTLVFILFMLGYCSK